MTSKFSWLLRSQVSRSCKKLVLDNKPSPHRSSFSRTYKPFLLTFHPKPIKAIKSHHLTTLLSHQNNHTPNTLSSSNSATKDKQQTMARMHVNHKVRFLPSSQHSLTFHACLLNPHHLSHTFLKSLLHSANTPRHSPNVRALANDRKQQMHVYPLIPRVLYLRRWGMRFSLGFGRSGRVSYG